MKFCICGHRVADHTQSWGSKGVVLSTCSLPDCACEEFVLKKRAA